MAGNPLSTRLGLESRLTGGSQAISISVGTAQAAANRTGFYSALTPGDEVLYVMVGGQVAAAFGRNGGISARNIDFATSVFNPGSPTALWVNAADQHLYFGNTDISAGGGGGAPTGPAGGDLGGTYPNPTVPQLRELSLALAVGANSVSSVPLTVVGDVLWELELVKGTERVSSTIRANHDGTTAFWLWTDLVLAPGLVLDVQYDVAVVGATMVLTASAATAGWTLNYRRRTLAD